MATALRSRRSDTARRRLAWLMRERGLSQTDLAQAIGVSKSMVSRFLLSRGDRMPSSHFVSQCASLFEVSTDWILGMEEDSHEKAELVLKNREDEDSEGRE